MNEVSGNQMWRESGTNLSYNKWIEREKAKGVFIPNRKALSEFHADGEREINNDESKLSCGPVPVKIPDYQKIIFTVIVIGGVIYLYTKMNV